MARKSWILDLVRHDIYHLLIWYDNVGNLPMRLSAFKECVRSYASDYEISPSILDKAFQRLYNDNFLGFKLAYPPSDPFIYIRDRASMEKEIEKYREFADIENSKARYLKKYSIL